MSIRVSEASARKLAGRAAAARAPRKSAAATDGRRAPQNGAQRARAGSARARCVECGAIIGKGRKSPTCAPCDLVALILGAGLPMPARELKFAQPERGWRADLAYPAAWLIIECDGGQFVQGGGRHNTDEDREKLNNAAARGWRVLRFSPQQLASDPHGCVAIIRRCLEGVSR
jgi:hypothetical protein